MPDDARRRTGGSEQRASSRSGRARGTAGQRPAERAADGATQPRASAEASGQQRRRKRSRGRGRADGDRAPGGRRRSAEQRARLVEARRARAPQITAASYPEGLPVSERRDELLAVLRDHQVVVVAGETGSGKTTQLPKMLLELGRGIEGQIAHTQPRRIAARSVAERIASELGSELGSAVGYAVRFDDRSGEDTLVRLVTDGLLLAEIQHDPLLKRYDAIVVDEAHERSLNIDFLLGVLHRILPQRPDLKVVITSATIDTQRFAEHFASPDGTPAPIVEVTGRTYPVEIRHRPPIDEDEREIDAGDAIAEAVEDLIDEQQDDILVFLSGEREIRDAAELLSGRLGSSAEILPLYARLGSAEQQRIFKRGDGRPRVVLATNVAETSLTVPGIKSVVDTGLARISRYSARLKVQRLPIEPISQASANQRAGRCGRVAPGVCIRLYNEQDFAARPEFTDPEILRTSLASVILRMAALGLGSVEEFPFLQPPDRRQVRDGLSLLHELAAIESPTGELKLTALGRRLARLPVDPRLGRMVLEAEQTGCASEVIAIAAALSIQDPRERPEEKREQAAQQHAQFKDERSDFLTFLNIWRWIQTERRQQTNSQFRKACKARYLHVMRIREWQDLVAQLRRSAKEVGLTLNEEPAGPDEIHRALLAGLLSHLGLKDPEKRDYLGARGSRFLIGRGTSLGRKQPTWVMAAELVETNRLWARTVAQIDPKDALRLGEHLVRRTYEEPRWDRRRGEVVATERVSLYGLPIVGGRAVPYAPHGDHGEARDRFLQQALVAGDWDAPHEFLRVNEQRIAEVERLEERVRQRGLLVQDAELRAFFAERVPEEIVSGRAFDRWWRKARQDDPHLLEYPKSLLLDAAKVETIDARDWPTKWRQGDLELTLSYDYEPGTDRDGVTVHAPLGALGQLRPVGFDWLVPGLREELIAALLRGLPKETRRALVPVPELAQQVARGVTPHSAPVAEAVAAEVLRLRGVRIDPAQLAVTRLPGHLQMRFRIEAPDGKVLADGHDLAAVRQSLRPTLQKRLADESATIERSGLTSWPEVDAAGNLPRAVALPGTGGAIRGYPSLVDEGGAIGVKVLGSPDEQAAAMHAGTRRLLLLSIDSPERAVVKQLTSRQQLHLAGAPYGGGAPAVLEDARVCAVDALLREAGGAVFEQAAFAALRRAVEQGLPARMLDVTRGAVATFEASARVEGELAALPVSHELADARTDVSQQLGLLVHDGFLAATGAERLAALPRYLDGMVARLQRLPTQIPVDRDRMHAIHALEDELSDAAERLGDGAAWPAHLTEAFWAIQELRLTQLAPGARAAGGVSAKRVRKLIAV